MIQYSQQPELSKKKIKLVKIMDSYKITLTKPIRKHLDVEIEDYIGYELLPNGRIDIFKPEIRKPD